MKFLVPTNFKEDLLSRLNKERVFSLYGKLNVDFIGGGRPSALLPLISQNRLAKYVAEVHRNNLEFDYLLNASCLGNREYSSVGTKQICRLLDWLMEIKVDSVTVAIPYLAQLIRKNYPQLKIRVSVFSNVDSLLKAKFWQDLGVESITLASTSLNRNFEVLNKIRKYIKCKLVIIANDSCFYKCPFIPYHSNVVSHRSQVKSLHKGKGIDFCTFNCRRMRLENPVNIICAIWIRPEDVHYYSEIGIDYLKFSGREMDSDFLVKTIDVYTKGSFKGNFAQILPFFYRWPKVPGIDKSIFIDNRILDGFFEFFVKGNCKQGCCPECGYCESIAKKAVKINA